MKIAVAGGTGFIGRALVRALIARGDNPRASYHRGIPLEDDACWWQQADFTEQADCERFVKDCEVVYHVAGITGGVALLRDDPMAFVNDNIIMAVRLFDACRKMGVRRVVYFSSTTGYPQRERLVENEYFEDSVYPAYFLPGNTRRFIERLTQMHPMEFVNLRCTAPYGPLDHFEPARSHVIAATIRKVAERHNPLVIWGEGKDRRDGTYIDDVVNALLLALDAPAGAYNIGTGRELTIHQMAQVLLDHAQDHTQIVHDLNGPTAIESRVLDLTKAKEVLKWEAKVPMEEGLIRTFDWYRTFYGDRH